MASLPVDNNGVIVELPSVPAAGASSANGYLILGIGTQSNNAPSGVTPYGAGPSRYVTTTFDGTPYYDGFLDTGSNGIFFVYDTTSYNGFYTPSSTLSLSALIAGGSNAPNQVTIPFQIENAFSLLQTGNMVFSDLGGAIPDNSFDWGLPFFLGRNVYVGIQGRSSPGLAVGPFWAF